MKEVISFVLNGERKNVEADSHRRLLDVLREGLHLTGTKEGCSTGHCGSCYVLVDNVVTKSCLTQIGRIRGRSVTTIEGIGSPSNPHPIQEAFVRKGAVQCGFCTPGLIIATKALLDSNPDPTPKEIAQALSNNLCRCTGYTKVIEAVLEAARVMRGETVTQAAVQGRVGDSVPQLDALAKATGHAKYAADMAMDGLVYAKVLRSPHAHALIKAIDTSMAEGVPGVVAVLTARDVPGTNRVGRTRQDEPILADGKVRHVGEPVAVVAASSTAIAQRALSKINVEYEQLPCIFDPIEALRQDAPQVHDGGNLLDSARVERGEVRAGFRDADLIVEETFSTPYVEHAYLEPEAGLAYIDEEGRVTIAAAAQNLMLIRENVARVLGLEHEQVRVIHTTTGGAFGGKLDLSVHGVLALLAYKLRRPAKLVYTRNESLAASTKRHPFQMTYRLGAKRDGRVTALQVSFVSNAGAYASYGPIGLKNAANHACGPYYFPNLLVEGKLVYTNGAVGGAMRGLGVPQVTFAIESSMDMLASKLGMDPLELRRINALRPGQQTATGQLLMDGLGLKPSLERVRERYLSSKHEAIEVKTSSSPYVKRGVGVASAWYGLGIIYAPDNSEAAAELTLEGTIRIFLGGPDEGQGMHTTMAQIAAEELSVPLNSVTVVTADTAVTPDTGGTFHSRQTYRAGNAVLLACQNLKKAILQTASKAMEVPLDGLELIQGEVISTSQPTSRMPMGEVAALCSEAGVPLKHLGRFERPVIKLNPENGQGDAFDTYIFCTHVAETEVNIKTGEVRVLRLIAAHEVGRAINPMGVEAQIQGGAMMGLGFALMEEFVPNKTHTLGQYKIPTTLDMPQIVPLIAESIDPTSPLGAVGVAELSLFPVAPAIANAICDACGIRLRDLPMTSEKLLVALREK